jgi:hypothetical protein
VAAAPYKGVGTNLGVRVTPREAGLMQTRPARPSPGRGRRKVGDDVWTPPVSGCGDDARVGLQRAGSEELGCGPR